ncbi:hypothetical protein LRS05_12520 [Flavobacterium sp. J372]|uniref:hypothetical protein n=1 Tax=Flavobacterium sp. J372 TaxID=2898436 RepID=UPI0021510DBF|nr:hypothetical protein [Flavobacterium sp. J372]MCR5862906.1 hypothetical protein [Flavobacterium sp. J372]
METVLTGAAVILAALIIVAFSTTKSKSEKVEEKRLQESLEDVLIYDPETGAKITLEQAESGNWLLPDQELKDKYDNDFRKFLDEDNLKVHDIEIKLRANGFRRQKLSEHQISQLENTSVLKKYDSWSYQISYINQSNTVVFFPFVELGAKVRGEDDYRETQLMFWTSIEDCGGHFYFREKTSIERITEIFRNDDEIKLNNYESFVLKKGYSVIPLIRLMQKIDKEKSLEIEVNNNNLFIKTVMKPTIVDYDRINKAVNN